MSFFVNDPAGAWDKIAQQMSYFLDQSAVQGTKYCGEGVASGQKFDGHNHRRRARAFRRKRRFRSTPRRLEYHLGRQSQTWWRYLGLFAEPLSLIRNGRRGVFPVTGLVDARERA